MRPEGRITISQRGVSPLQRGSSLFTILFLATGTWWATFELVPEVLEVGTDPLMNAVYSVGFIALSSFLAYLGLAALCNRRVIDVTARELRSRQFPFPLTWKLVVPRSQIQSFGIRSLTRTQNSNSDPHEVWSIDYIALDGSPRPFGNLYGTEEQATFIVPTIKRFLKREDGTSEATG